MAITNRGLTVLVAAMAAGCADLPDDINNAEQDTAPVVEQKAQAVVDGDPCEARRLQAFWSGANEDNATTTSGTPASGYSFIGNEGYVLAFAAPSTVQLKQYFSSGRGDYMLVAAGGLSEYMAQVSGYTVWGQPVGYAYSSQVAGTVPLRWFWHAGRGDNFTTSLTASANVALAAGYEEIGVVAYVFADNPIKTLAVYWSGARLDYVTTAVGGGVEAAAISAGYTRLDDDSYIFKYAVPGTTELENFWSSARTENALVSVANRADPINAGYTLSQSEGYALSSAVTGWTYPLIRFWHSEYQDNWTVSTTPLGGTGYYVPAVTEGHVMHGCPLFVH